MFSLTFEHYFDIANPCTIKAWDNPVTSIDTLIGRTNITFKKTSYYLTNGTDQ